MDYKELTYVIIMCALFIAACIVIIFLKKQKKSFNFRVLSALGMGLLLGALIQFTSQIFFSGATSDEAVSNITTFLSIFGSGYIALLKIIVIPLIFVAMISSIMNLKGDASISKIVPKVLLVLVVTVSIAATVGIAASTVVGLDNQAEKIYQQDETFFDGICTSAERNGEVENISAECQKELTLETTQTEVTGTNYADIVLSFIPSNLFYMLTGQNSSDTLSTVIFGMFIGYAVLQVRRRKPKKVETFVNFIDATKEVVLSLTREILKLTPFGVMALMTTFMATNDYSSLSFFILFIVASYGAIIVMYLIHLLIIFLFGLSPLQYAKKTYSVLLFGFSSRSSAATLPLNIEAQTNQLGVDTETANISGTFGTSIGQNGCAGIYPAMVAIMTAYAYGLFTGDTFSLSLGFILKLVIVIAISSFGIAGVGGGATFAAVAVLTIMGLPIQFAALLVAVEPLIDMARTALNVSDSMVAGVVTARWNKTLNRERYDGPIIDLDSEGVEL